MKKLAIILSVLALVLVASPTFAKKSEHAKGPKDKCTTIQSGELLASDETVITTGYDQWGYNYQARLFNGYYCDAYRDDAWCQPYKDVELSMKWNDAWLSNKDCDDDGELDRHYGYPSYIGSGAWLTNHQSGYDSMQVDAFDLGDLESESGHNLDGWSNPWNWGGNYGEGDDGTFRLIMGPGDGCGLGYESASFTIGTEESMADKLILRHLDGSQDDDFDVYLWNGADYDLIGSYESQGGGEEWVDTAFEFTPQSGELKFKLTATGNVTNFCSNWGQVAVSYATLKRTYQWNYFVKIVAAPSNAELTNGTWYDPNGNEIGKEIWGEFAIVHQVSNDPGTGEHGLIYKGSRPSLGGWEY